MTGSAGLASAKDDDVSVFADNHRGVLLTHDHEFSKRRRAEVVGKHLEELVSQAGYRDAIFLKLSKDGVKPYPNRWD